MWLFNFIKVILFPDAHQRMSSLHQRAAAHFAEHGTALCEKQASRAGADAALGLRGAYGMHIGPRLICTQ